MFDECITDSSNPIMNCYKTSMCLNVVSVCDNDFACNMNSGSSSNRKLNTSNGVSSYNNGSNPLNNNDFACGKILSPLNNDDSGTNIINTAYNDVPTYNRDGNPLNNKSASIKMVSSLSSSTTPLHIWHKRLAHASYTTLQHLNSLDILLILDSNKKNDLHACEVRHKAKQARLPFHVSTRNTTTDFELLHMDIWGPYTQPSLTRTSYMLTLVDDYSRACWIYLLQHKTQVTTTFASFIRMVQTQYEKKVRNIRTDNGSEFLNVNFKPS